MNLCIPQRVGKGHHTLPVDLLGIKYEQAVLGEILVDQGRKPVECGIV